MTLDNEGERTAIAHGMNQIRGVTRPNQCTNPVCRGEYPIHYWVCPHCGWSCDRKKAVEKKAREMLAKQKLAGGHA